MIPAVYLQDGYEPVGRPHLPKVEYQRIRREFVVACVDAVLYSSDGERNMVLAKRKIQPHQDWWLIGGEVRSEDESLQVAMSRKIYCETRITIPPTSIPEHVSRIHFCKWANGRVDLCHVFLISISKAEYQLMCENLDQSSEFSEYKLVSSREVAMSKNYHPALRDCAKILVSL